MNKFIRLILVLLSFLIFGVGSLTLSLVIFPILTLCCNKKEAYANVIHKSWRFFIGMLEFLKIIRININLNQKYSGKIIVASHPSFIDIIILIALFPKSTCMAKNNVLKNPFFSNIVRNIYIVNDISLDKLVKLSKEYLDNGFNIIIFPTGTRTAPNEEIKIHKGAAEIALATGCEIVPIKLTTNFPFLCKNSPIYHVGDSTVIYDLTIQPGIDPKNYYQYENIKARKYISERIKDFIK